MWVEDRKNSRNRVRDSHLIEEASRGEYSCKQLKDKMDLDVHVRTICNYLNSSGQLK